MNHSTELLPIGEAARRLGMATSALRYYESRSLVEPASRVGGRRLYGRAELRKIAFIQMGRRVGVGLDQLSTVLAHDGPGWPAMVDEHLRWLDERIGWARDARQALVHARSCPHERPWENCAYMVATLDAWVDSAATSASPMPLGSGAVEEPPHRWPDPDLAGLRRSYERGALSEEAVAPDPLDQFRRWLHDALIFGVSEPNAMVLATASADGVPSARTVLLKGVTADGFAFFTNYESGKAADLASNPQAALVFPWHAMERQVRVTGAVARLSSEESLAYFQTRPRDSQLSAWASPQSTVVSGRRELDASYAAVESRFPEGSDVPLPSFWGGYRVRPSTVEFWQGRHGRLHDRLRYRLEAGEWKLERLAP